MDKRRLTHFAVQARTTLQSAVADCVMSMPIYDAKQVIEEVSYTWFIRLCALRYMEVNGYLSTPIFTNNDNTCAEISDPPLYKNCIIAQCRELGALGISLFSPVTALEEELFPESLIGGDAKLLSLMLQIPRAEWKEGVQILGWLFQYYHADKRDAAIAALNDAGYISYHLLPAATQLFTPEWIVRYLVENSLGRLWLSAHPNSELQSGWKYYLQEPVQSSPRCDALVDVSPQDITCMDPCMGSGHILAYVFDVLMQIYRTAGYDDTAAVASIIRNNIHGLDIDERAAQLAAFTVTMKAREYDADWLSHCIVPRVYAVKESTHFHQNVDDVSLFKLFDDMKDASEYGSLLRPACSPETLERLRNTYGRASTIGVLADTAELLCRQYDVVVTNPPYLGAAGMSDKLSAFVKQHYPDSKADLYAVFMERCMSMTRRGKYLAMVTQHTWMFLAGFQSLRRRMLQECIISLLHLGARAFDEIPGEVVQTAAFVIRKQYDADYRGVYCRLTDVLLPKEKESLFHAHTQEYVVNQAQFSQVAGSPVLYWLHPALLRTFSLPTLSSVGVTINGLTTGDNGKFVRLWHEVCFDTIDYGAVSIEESVNRGRKWFPYNKGGGYCKWYGNNDFVINWYDNGREVKEHGRMVSRGMRYQFLPSITWSKIASTSPSFRIKGAGSMFDVGGLSLFPHTTENTLYLLGLLNSTYARHVLQCLSPTVNCETGHVASLPVLIPPDVSCVSNLVSECIRLCRDDWDLRETSPDFKRHPLVRPVASLRAAYNEWEKEAQERFSLLKHHEEEINRHIIKLYQLHGTVSPAVQDEEVTVSRAEPGRDVRSLLSFAVGCMFGRYSLDEVGLVYAGGAWTPRKYSRFTPCVDNIIPICSPVPGVRDIVAWVEDFLVAVYGAESLEDNLSFIAKALGKKSKNPRIVLRRYFQKEFYADHCRVYKKRPIYWMFDSGKEGSFKALMYMHRYNDRLLSHLLTHYIQPALSHLFGMSAPDEELQQYEQQLRERAQRGIQLDSDAGVKYNYTALFPQLLAKIR